MVINAYEWLLLVINGHQLIINVFVQLKDHFCRILLKILLFAKLFIIKTIIIAVLI